VTYEVTVTNNPRYRGRASFIEVYSSDGRLLSKRASSLVFHN